MASPEEMAQKMLDNIPEKTGKTLKQWFTLVKKSGAAKHGEIVKFLKGDHEVTHGYANLIARQFLDAGQPSASSGDLVEAQYGGDKAALLPIYEALIKEAQKLGKDVEVSPKKAYVSLRRKKQFGLIQPSTKTRVDLGLNLKGVAAKGRLEKSGSFNSMVSHRVKLSKKSEVNAELKKWLKEAYEGA